MRRTKGNPLGVSQKNLNLRRLGFVFQPNLRLSLTEAYWHKGNKGDEGDNSTLSSPLPLNTFEFVCQQ